MEISTPIAADVPATACEPDSHEWGALQNAKEPDFGVVFFMLRTCHKCQFQEIENLCATRASGGPIRIFPPDTLRLDARNRIINAATT